MKDDYYKGLMLLFSVMSKFSNMNTDADDYVDSLPSPHILVSPYVMSTRSILTIVLGMMLLTSLVVSLS